MYPKKLITIEVDTHWNVELDNWAFDSHMWHKTKHVNLEKCFWCNKIINGYQGINKDQFPLCKENPKVKEMLCKNQ